MKHASPLLLLFVACAASSLPLTKPAPTSPAWSGVIIVLAVLLAAAYLAKRYGRARLEQPVPIKVVGSTSLGGRDRVAVIEVAGQWIIVGVSPGAVTSLATMPAQPLAQVEANDAQVVTTTFHECLGRWLHKKGTGEPR